MEQNFQTSFIPKKPMVEQETTVHRPASLLLIASIFIFLVIVLASGGAYFYKGVLANSVTKMESDLNLAKNRFEPSEISKLGILDKRLNSASEILSNHIAISPIFETLQTLTLKSIRYTKFSYDIADSGIVVKMSGQAVGYRSVALQADLFAKNKNLIDPSFTNLTLDDQGNVIFDLEFSVNKSFVNYGEILKIKSDNSSNVNVADTGTVN